MKKYEFNGTKYIVNRESLEDNGKLLDNLIYLLLEFKNIKVDSEKKGENYESKSRK